MALETGGGSVASQTHGGGGRSSGSHCRGAAATVDEAADELRERIAIEGARRSYQENCESMQRVHISPALGKRKVD